MNKFLQADIMPSWYEMAFQGWQGEEMGIIIRIHEELVRDIEPITESSPIVEGFRKEWFDSMFDTWNGEFGRDQFGFNGSFKLRGRNGEFVEYLIPIPQIDKPINEACDNCDGTGKDRFMEDEKCYPCFGTGREYRIDWHTANSISASLSVFSMLSEYPRIETSCRLPQLLTFHAGAKPCYLGGVYGIPLVKYMAHLGKDTVITAMVNAMKMTWQKMMGVREFEEHRFSAWVAYDNGWLNVYIPGDACGLNPSHLCFDKGRGYEFTDHNVDNPMQQLTLIAGLAALYEKARYDMARNPKRYL